MLILILYHYMQYLWPYDGSFRHHNLYPPPFKSCIRLWFWAFVCFTFF